MKSRRRALSLLVSFLIHPTDRFFALALLAPAISLTTHYSLRCQRHQIHHHQIHHQQMRRIRPSDFVLSVDNPYTKYHDHSDHSVSMNLSHGTHRATEIKSTKVVLLEEAICRRVARQDPRWYQTYVVEVIGSSPVVGSTVIAALKEASHQYHQKQQEQEPHESYTRSAGALIKDACLLDDVENRRTTFDAATDDESTTSTKKNVTPDDKLLRSSTSSTTRSPKAAADQSIPSKAKSERVVAYRDSMRRREWSPIPLLQFLELGYTESDIMALHPDALELIINQSLMKPQNGIPDRWKIRSTRQQYNNGKESPPDVQIDPLKNLKVLPDKQFNMQQEIPRRVDILSDPQKKEGTRSSRDSPSIRYPLESRRINRVTSRSRKEDSQRVETHPQPFMSSRRIQTKNERRIMIADPPTPRSSFWPDIHSFKDMLRNEATLRIRILGENFAGVVKDESDWRLNLYKRWLWAIHNGVGDPLIESRSDRRKRHRMKSRYSMGISSSPPPSNEQRSSSTDRSSSVKKGKQTATLRDRQRRNPETI